jgi:hypothetical protein
VYRSQEMLRGEKSGGAVLQRLVALPSIFLLFFPAFSGCAKPDTTPEILFSKVRKEMNECKRLFEANGKMHPDNQDWDIAVRKLQTFNPKLVVSLKGKFLFVEIMTKPSDLYEGFVYLPSGSQLEEFLQHSNFVYNRLITKRSLDDQWVWIHYD